MEDRDSILIDFKEARPEADLAEWVRRYPEHARDLTRLAMQRWCAGTATADPVGDVRFGEIGRETLLAVRTARLAPLTSLKATAQARGLDPEAVAERLHLPVEYFWKLQRRLFHPDSVPRALVAALAETLGRTADDIAAYLQRPPQLAAGASYRAETAPRVGEREDFIATVQGDPDLTPEQRDHWAGRGDH